MFIFMQYYKVTLPFCCYLFWTCQVPIMHMIITFEFEFWKNKYYPSLSIGSKLISKMKLHFFIDSKAFYKSAQNHWIVTWCFVHLIWSESASVVVSRVQKSGIVIDFQITRTGPVTRDNLQTINDSSDLFSNNIQRHMYCLRNRLKVE